jgi:hypothetical protein
MFMNTTKTGKKGKAMTKAGIGTLSGGSFKCEYKIEIRRGTGFAVGTKNIPALFWSPMSSVNGKKVTVEEKQNGND